MALEAGRYLLYVSRLEPENHAHTVIEAYRRAGGEAGLGIPLVVVGDAPYATDYKAELQAAAETGRRACGLPGYVFGEGYAELQSNALAYVQATEVGGTHPALVEAMGRGATIIANDVPEHREVLGDAGRYYDRNDPDALAAALRAIVEDGPEVRASLGAAACRTRRGCVLVGARHGLVRVPVPRSDGAEGTLTPPTPSRVGWQQRGRRSERRRDQEDGATP